MACNTFAFLSETLQWTSRNCWGKEEEVAEGEGPSAQIFKTRLDIHLFWYFYVSAISSQSFLISLELLINDEITKWATQDWVCGCKICESDITKEHLQPGFKRRMCVIGEYRKSNEGWCQRLTFGGGLGICLNLLFGSCDVFFWSPHWWSTCGLYFITFYSVKDVDSFLNRALLALCIPCSRIHSMIRH